MKPATAALVCVLGAVALSGCMSTRTERSTVIGGLTGATIGAVSAGSVGGAAVGGAIGAATGYIVAENTYRCWRTNIFGKRYKGWCIG